MLEQLQEIDSEIDSLKRNRNDLDKELDAITGNLVLAKNALAESENRLAELEQAKGELEKNLGMEHENIKRAETNMKEIKTNKEFQAVGREIAAARKQVAELEEEFLDRLSRIEEINAAIAKGNSDFVELEKNSAERRNQKEKELASISESINAGSERREVIVAQLSASIMKRYENLRAQRRGQALAVARDGYCLGCNMQLPPQLYNSLFRNDEMLLCPHCQRILILKQG